MAFLWVNPYLGLRRLLRTAMAQARISSRAMPHLTWNLCSYNAIEQ